MEHQFQLQKQLTDTSLSGFVTWEKTTEDVCCK